MNEKVLSLLTPRAIAEIMQAAETVALVAEEFMNNAEDLSVSEEVGAARFLNDPSLPMIAKLSFLISGGVVSSPSTQHAHDYIDMLKKIGGVPADKPDVGLN